MKTPDVAGFPVLGAGGYRAWELNVHYNNPTLKSAIMDNSKLKIYLSRTPREHAVGVLQVCVCVIMLINSSLHVVSGGTHFGAAKSPGAGCVCVLSCSWFSCCCVWCRVAGVLDCTILLCAAPELDQAGSCTSTIHIIFIHFVI